MQKQNKTNLMLCFKQIPPKRIKYIEAKNKLLINVKSFARGEKKLFKGLKNRIFPINCVAEEEGEEEEKARYEEEEINIRNENGLLDHRRLQRLLDLKYRDINDGLVRKHSQVQDLAALLVKLRKSKYNLQKIKFR